MAADAKKKQIQTAEEKKPSGQRKAASAKRTQQAAEKKSGERKNTAKKETSAKPASGRADAKKRAASKRTSDKPVNIKLTEKELLDFPILDEVLIWASLAVCVILMFSMFGFGGKIGTAIGEFFFGIFGFMAYLAPFLLFFLIAFLISNEGSLLAWIKGASMVLLYMCLCGFTELLSNRYLSSRKLVDYYKWRRINRRLPWKHSLPGCGSGRRLCSAGNSHDYLRDYDYRAFPFKRGQDRRSKGRKNGHG